MIIKSAFGFYVVVSGLTYGYFLTLSTLKSGLVTLLITVRRHDIMLMPSGFL
jgi:hypothetical protein